MKKNQILRSARGKLIALKNEPNNCPQFFKGKRDLVYFFEDWSKLKRPSEISPPLKDIHLSNIQNSKNAQIMS